MTRINLVDPVILSDKHLMAEYRELPRIFTAVGKLIGKGVKVTEVDIPDQYVLGQGHCKFFYNKLQWLCIRYELLYKELLRRKFNLDKSIYEGVTKSYAELIKYGWWHGWKPTAEEIYLNMSRLCKRSKMERVLLELSTNT